MSEPNTTIKKKSGIFGATAFALALFMGAATAQNSQRNDSANSKQTNTGLPKDSTQPAGKNAGDPSSGASQLFSNFNTNTPSDPYFAKDKSGTPDKSITWEYSASSSQPSVYIKPTKTRENVGNADYLGYNAHGAFLATDLAGIIQFDGEKVTPVSNAPDHLYNSRNLIIYPYPTDVTANAKPAAQHPKGNSGSDVSNKNADDAGPQAGEGIFSGKDPQGSLKDKNGVIHKLVRPRSWKPGSSTAGIGQYVEVLSGGSANLYYLTPGTEGDTGKRNFYVAKLPAQAAQMFLPVSGVGNKKQ